MLFWGIKLSLYKSARGHAYCHIHVGLASMCAGVTDDAYKEYAVIQFVADTDHSKYIQGLKFLTSFRETE